jgi:hypothetical protein
LATYTAQLAAVEEAIAKAESGQEVTFADGRRIRRGDLAAMYAERTRLTALAAREGAGRAGPNISRGAGT